MSKKGGYVIVDLKGQSITAGTPFTLDGVTARLDRAKNKACLLSGFAIGNDEKRDVFVDLQKTEDGYVALFGQYTITIEDDEVTITDGGILMDNIVDSQGNKRFVEGTVTLTSAITGLTLTYGKWSLSGTHLMIVVAGEYSTALTTSQISNAFTVNNLPSYVTDKIKTINLNRVEIKAWSAMNTEYNTYYRVIELIKDTITGLHMLIGTGTEPTANGGYRCEFDLLIDSEVE